MLISDGYEYAILNASEKGEESKWTVHLYDFDINLESYSKGFDRGILAFYYMEYWDAHEDYTNECLLYILKKDGEVVWSEKGYDNEIMLWEMGVKEKNYPWGEEDD